MLDIMEFYRIEIEWWTNASVNLAIIASDNGFWSDQYWLIVN